MSTSTGNRGMGLTAEQQALQDKKIDEDFRYECNQRLQNHDFAFSDIDQQMKALRADIESKAVDMARSNSLEREKVLDLLKGFRTRLDDQDHLIRQFENVSTRVESAFNANAVMRSEFDHKIEKFASLVDEALKICSKLQIDLMNRMDALEGQCVALIKQYRDEVFAKPTGIPELRKEFDDKLEIVSLNGQNSQLRSSNNERELHLIQKKIENIYQLIKQIELK